MTKSIKGTDNGKSEKAKNDSAVEKEINKKVISELKKDIKVLDDSKEGKSKSGAKSVTALASEIFKKP